MLGRGPGRDIEVRVGLERVAQSLLVRDAVAVAELAIAQAGRNGALAEGVQRVGVRGDVGGLVEAEALAAELMRGAEPGAVPGSQAAGDVAGCGGQRADGVRTDADDLLDRHTAQPHLVLAGGADLPVAAERDTAAAQRRAAMAAGNAGPGSRCSATRPGSQPTVVKNSGVSLAHSWST